MPALVVAAIEVNRGVTFEPGNTQSLLDMKGFSKC